MPTRSSRFQSPWPEHYVGQRVRCRFLLVRGVWQPFGLTTPLSGDPWLRSTADGPIVEGSFQAVLTDLRTVSWVPEACRFWQLPIIDAGPPDVNRPVFEAMRDLETVLGTDDVGDAFFVRRRVEAEAMVADHVWNGDEALKEQAFSKARELVLTGHVVSAWVRHGNCSQPYRFRPFNQVVG